MPPLQYHPGQRAVQDEANTRTLADHLSEWVGPIVEFSTGADLFLLASQGEAGELRFTVLSGPAPLVDVAGPARLRLRFPRGAERPAAGRVGGLGINLSVARRARVNGELVDTPDGMELRADETFTLCRKYMAPSLAAPKSVLCGPAAREQIPMDDAWLTGLLARAETSFLGSATPDGAPDVAHRGGPEGFISLDSTTRTLSWPEFVGDGVFKSAGNVRATGQLTLLVIDTESGDGAEILGHGDYRNVRTQRSQRLEPLVQFRDKYPVQGEISCSVDKVYRLTAVIHPRKRIEKALKVTSASTTDDQAPQ